MAHRLFIGNALCGVNAAGRMILPAFVRAALACRSDAPVVLVGAHEFDPCLVAYDRNHIETLVSDCRRRRVAEEASAPNAHHSRERRMFGFVEETGLDETGAIRLPPMMRRRARIDDLALILGAGDTFEIWSPAMAIESADPELVELARFHLEIEQAA